VTFVGNLDTSCIRSSMYSLTCVAVCCSVLQCVAVSGVVCILLRVLQRVAACCSVLQC